MKPHSSYTKYEESFPRPYFLDDSAPQWSAVGIRRSLLQERQSAISDWGNNCKLYAQPS